MMRGTTGDIIGEDGAAGATDGRRLARLARLAPIGFGVVVFALLGGAALALNIRHGEALFAERLIAGIANCF